MKAPITAFVFCTYFLASVPLISADEPKHLLVAKFLLKRLEPLNLTEKQRESFNSLSAQLRTDVDALRKESGISKEVMTRRDEAHQALRDLKLEDEAYWARLQTDADLNEAQLTAFKKTAEMFDAFKKAANGLLTDDQRATMKKRGPKKKVNPPAAPKTK